MLYEVITGKVDAPPGQRGASLVRRVEAVDEEALAELVAATAAGPARAQVQGSYNFV